MRKRGSITIVIISLTILVLMITIFLSYLLYCQIAVQLTNIKNDIFSVCQNAIVYYNQEELSYENYLIDIEALKERIEYLINKNNIKDGSNIKKIVVKELRLIEKKQEIINHDRNFTEPIIHVVIEVHFKPVSNLFGEEIKIVKFHEDIKLSLMQH